MSPYTQAQMDVLAERRRQIEAEDWSPENDNQYVNGELVAAGAAYALEAVSEGGTRGIWFKRLWPWHLDYWKPKSRRRDLVRAAALLIAEIERIDRAEAERVAS